MLVYLLKNEFGICTSGQKNELHRCFPGLSSVFCRDRRDLVRVLAYNLGGLCDDMFDTE